MMSWWKRLIFYWIFDFENQAVRNVSDSRVRFAISRRAQKATLFDFVCIFLSTRFSAVGTSN